MNQRKLETHGTILVQEHYRQIGIEAGWSNERVGRLCVLLNCTMHELGALVGLSFGLTSSYERQNKWPPPIALHFALLENWYWSVIKKSPRPPVMPLDLIVNV